jgi:hypothetical protein
VPKKLDVYLVMDNYGTHKTPTVQRWLARERQIRRGTHHGTIELERAIRDYLSVNNRDPKPFVWSKTADQILESIKRFCM